VQLIYFDDLVLGIRGGPSRRGVAKCSNGESKVDALAKVIMKYMDRHNENPRPFKWTASADLILD
jgi:hypothetical protein